MVHEIFHLDAHSSRSSFAGHVYDRTIEISNGSTGFQIVGAYGPLYTKVLANWAKDVGKYVATNGKSQILTTLKQTAYPYPNIESSG